MNIKTALISTALAIAIISAGLFFYLRTDRMPESLGIFISELPGISDKESFRFEVVDTEEARVQGLSGRTDVPAGYGMLFVFDRPDRYGFWMKDMQVSIDMIWLADNGTILAIDEAVLPDTYPTPFYPPRPVRLVLETRAGEAKAQGWSVGTRIALPL